MRNRQNRVDKGTQSSRIEPLKREKREKRESLVLYLALQGPLVEHRQLVKQMFSKHFLNESIGTISSIGGEIFFPHSCDHDTRTYCLCVIYGVIFDYRGLWFI